jgi:hypothetical protein
MYTTADPKPGDPGFWDWVKTNKPHNFPQQKG